MSGAGKPYRLIALEIFALTAQRKGTLIPHGRITVPLSTTRRLPPVFVPGRLRCLTSLAPLDSDGSMNRLPDIQKLAVVTMVGWFYLAAAAGLEAKSRHGWKANASTFCAAAATLKKTAE